MKTSPIKVAKMKGNALPKNKSIKLPKVKKISSKSLKYWMKMRSLRNWKKINRFNKFLNLLILKKRNLSTTPCWKNLILL